MRTSASYFAKGLTTPGSNVNLPPARCPFLSTNPGTSSDQEINLDLARCFRTNSPTHGSPCPYMDLGVENVCHCTCLAYLHLLTKHLESIVVRSLGKLVGRVGSVECALLMLFTTRL